MPTRDAQYLRSLIEERYAIEGLDSLAEPALTKARAFRGEDGSDNRRR